MLLDATEAVYERRLARGLSLDDVAGALGWSRTKVWRVEHGDPATTVIDLCQLCAVVGLDPSLRLFPGQPLLRDAGQARMLERFHERLHPSWMWATEVPLPLSGDQRAWDGFLRGAGVRIGVEAESRLRDGQAVLRRLMLKQRDGGVDHVVLLLPETRATTEAMAVAGAYLRATLPLGTRAMLRALGAGRDPGRSGIVVL